MCSLSKDPSLFRDPSRSFHANLGSDSEFEGGIQAKLGKMDLEYVKTMYKPSPTPSTAATRATPRLHSRYHVACVMSHAY